MPTRWAPGSASASDWGWAWASGWGAADPAPQAADATGVRRQRGQQGGPVAGGGLEGLLLSRTQVGSPGLLGRDIHGAEPGDDVAQRAGRQGQGEGPGGIGGAGA